jgi:hypothetical protein
MKMFYLKNHEIDKQRYNKCITESITPKVYAYAWYLDEVCDGRWDAIVNEDYSIVFPLPYAYKLGFLRYINPPPFVQQLGVFSSKIDEKIMGECFKALPYNFIVLRQYFNSSNIISKPYKTLVNYQLPLDDYDKIKKNYNNDLRNNLKKIDFDKVTIDTSADIDLTIQNFKNTYPTINDNRYALFKNAALQSIKLSHGINLGFYLDGQPLAFTFFLKNHFYFQYIMPGPTPLGRKHSIIQSILDYIIKTNCGKSLTLDFEGSSIPNVAQLYKKYNPHQEIYHLKHLFPLKNL